MRGISWNQGSCLDPILFLLYVNDQSSAATFNATLFADDIITDGMLSDKNFKEFENANEQIVSIDGWSRKNILSLNYSKTNYVIINKNPRAQINFDFSIWK